ncbi:hypothetical protein ACFU53_46255 [Streptomyces sp. NPDC057474]|uniref:hypothetical protein n=1 Tax=Streptomyces sp. NPDC057474 TaxID=3346144 RepID=UPI0036D061FD
MRAAVIAALLLGANSAERPGAVGSPALAGARVSGFLARQRHRRRTLSPAAPVWGHLLDVTVGYGYRPWPAGVWLLTLTLLGTTAFATGSPTAVKPGEGAPFQPFVHTLDLLIPSAAWANAPPGTGRTAPSSGWPTP